MSSRQRHYMLDLARRARVEPPLGVFWADDARKVITRLERNLASHCGGHQEQLL